MMLYRKALPVGAVFDTPFEEGCIVTGTPDVVGNFAALDSDGVECSFSPVMVERVHPLELEHDRAAS